MTQYSRGAMGQGIAVKPSQDVVYAPADAEVTIVFPTGHAYGLRTANGAEILIHVGIDTVSMNGEGFNHKVAQGDKVKAGDVLGTFDSAKIAAAGLDNTTMVIVTNTADFASVNPVALDQLLRVTQSSKLKPNPLQKSNLKQNEQMTCLFVFA